jgi:uncharacterized protein YqcC (DUF446 family)
MSDPHIRLAEILMDVEKELRELRLWESELPPPDALASTQPFAIDWLNFAQWLQFIFIPKLYLLIEERAPLPTNCGVAPMAEEYFRSLNLYSAPLIEHLRRIDLLLTQ